MVSNWPDYSWLLCEFGARDGIEIKGANAKSADVGCSLRFFSGFISYKISDTAASVAAGDAEGLQIKDVGRR